MSDRRIRRLLLATFCLIAALFSMQQAEAGDYFRQMGLGYSAGYHAPAAPFVQPSSAARWGGWKHWKSACCQPGPATTDCGCAPAPVAPACGCGPAVAPCCPQPCCPNMGPRHPGIY